METKARSKKVHLILNGKAAGNDALQTAVARQQALGHGIEVRMTREKGEARRFVAEAGEAELVIAAGGDGTLNEVVHGLMDLSPGRAVCFGTGLHWGLRMTSLPDAAFRVIRKERWRSAWKAKRYQSMSVKPMSIGS